MYTYNTYDGELKCVRYSATFENQAMIRLSSEIGNNQKDGRKAEEGEGEVY